MSIIADNLPISRNNATSVRQITVANAIFWGIGATICSIIALNHFSNPANNHVEKFGFIFAVTPWIIWGAALIFFRKSIIDNLLIDSIGIHITRNGILTDYLWADIASSSVVSIPSGTRAPPTLALKIKRKGIVDIKDDGTDLIYSDFGFNLVELDQIVKDCILRWGAQPDADATDRDIL